MGRIITRGGSISLPRNKDVARLRGFNSLAKALAAAEIDTFIDPVTLFSSTPGYILNPSIVSTMWQDAAGTTPVTAAGDPVGRILDVSGNGYVFTQATAGNRPTWQINPTTGAGLLRFNGTSQCLASTATVSFAATTKLFVACGLDRAGTTQRYVMFASYGTGAGSWAVLSPVGNDSTIGLACRGTANAYQSLIFGPGTVKAVFSATWDMAVSTNAGAFSNRLNGPRGPFYVPNGTPGTAANGNNVTNYIGSTNTPSGYLSGDLYYAVACGKQVTATERAGVENYINDKTGVW
jgi:hypothetical protein